MLLRLCCGAGDEPAMLAAMLLGISAALRSASRSALICSLTAPGNIRPSTR